MPKGRVFAPHTNTDGVWFHHRGLPDPGPLMRDSATSTGVMLTSPYKPHTAQYPPGPPKPYKQKDAGNFKSSNAFSAHDNRHSFQDHGVYFGDGRNTRGLGKNIIENIDRQHHTDEDYLKHYGRRTVNYDYKTEYYKQYGTTPSADQPTRRRFPKIHNDGDPNATKLDTTTTDWYQSPDVPHRTPTQVLATAQEPFLPANSWKYSYHGRSQCYPSYNIKPQKYRSWYLPGLSDSNVQEHTGDVAA